MARLYMNKILTSKDLGLNQKANYCYCNGINIHSNNIMKKIITNKKEITALAIILIIFGLVMFLYNINTPMWLDEFIFTKLSMNLPHYSTTSNWVYSEGTRFIPTIQGYNSWDINSYKLIYDAPIYLHMPIAPIIVWPLTHFTDNIYILRIFSIIIALACMLLAYLISKKLTGNYAFTIFLPILISIGLLSGAMWFYWDIFMVFFFLLTLYLMEVKPNSKWIYVAGICLVLTKMYIGMLLLLILMFKNKKIFFCSLAIIPIYIWTLIVTGDLLYWLTHYTNQIQFHNDMYTKYIFPMLWATLWSWNFIPYIILTGSCVIFFKKYLVYIAFYIVAILYGLGFGMGTYQAAMMLYSGGLALAIICKEFRVERFLEKKLI